MYETETEYTLEEYKKMQKTLFAKNLYVHFFMWLFVVVLILVTHNYYSMYSLIVVLLDMIFLTLKWYIQNKKIKKVYSLNGDIKKKYTFCEDHFEEEFCNEKRYIYYHDISLIIETETDFYIKFSKYRWFIIKKCNSSTELLNLIRKYKNYY